MSKPLFWPRVEQMESRLVPSVVNVHAGDNLQAAINRAQPGDQLVLDAGATFNGSITLPNRAGDQAITIESAALDHLPAPGQRVGPGDAAWMPKITSPGSGLPALATAVGAHNYRLVGIEILPATKDAVVYDLVELGDGSGAQNSLAQVPHDLTLDQCYVHAWPNQSLKRGIALNSAATAIVDSYIAGFKVIGQDSQAIAGWNGPGPFQIDNNYLEAAGENILFGGAGTSIPNLVPSDIEIRGNLVSKPLAWNSNDPTTYAGQHWTVKNLLELKNAQRVTVDSNRFENNWLDGQVGFAIVLTPRGAQSGGPWAVVRNVTFTTNVVIHTAHGFNILGSDDSSTSGVTQNILIQNNSFDDIGSKQWGTSGGRLFQLSAGLAGGTNGVTVDHNVATSVRNIILAQGIHSNFVFTNNQVPHGQYGVMANSAGEGTASLKSGFPGYTFQGNIIPGADPKAYPPGNFYGTTSYQHFITQLYADLLQRPVDTPGMVTWTAALAQGAFPGQVVQAIVTSPEFLTLEVSNLYTTFLHRAVDASGLATFTAFLAGGGSVEQLAAILTASDEYFLTQGQGNSDGFLDALYRDGLNRPVDPSGRTAFDSALQGDTTRAQVATAVFTSVEYRQNEVVSFYQRFLHRNADSGGLAAFVSLLLHGSRTEGVMAAIIGSVEYAGRSAS